MNRPAALAIQLSGERSITAPAIHADAWIEFWAPVFMEPHNRRRLWARGVSFEAFLAAPHYHLEVIDAFTRCEIAPGLLPEQRETQRRADLARYVAHLTELALRAVREDARCSNGAWVEKWRHHAYPRHGNQTWRT